MAYEGPRATGHLVKEDESSGEGVAPASKPAAESGRVDNVFSEAGGAAVAAILHVFRLTAAELVLSRDNDVARFEQAVRTKLGEFTSPTANQEARLAGLAHARFLVDQVLMQIRAQAELKKSLAATPHSGERSDRMPAIHPVPKSLN